MEWKYRKDFQFMPGVLVKYGTNGIKTEILPPIDTIDIAFEADKLKNQLFKPYEAKYEIKSAPIDKLTSPELAEFKNILLTSGKNYDEIQTILKSKTANLNANKRKFEKLNRSFLKFLFKKKLQRLSKQLVLLNEEIEELKAQLNYSSIRLEIDSEDVFTDLYKNVKKAFTLLTQSEKKWDFTSSKQTNKVVERTSASSTITRSEINLSETNLPIIQFNDAALCLHNINGGDLYFYPGFLIVYESKSDFAVINYTELDVIYYVARFIESERVPNDTQVIDHTWFKVNKDGSPDRRFSNNYKIPVVQYGHLHFTSKSGLNEEYCFSNAELPMLFQKALFDYIDSLKKSQSLIDSFKVR